MTSSKLQTKFSSRENSKDSDNDFLIKAEVNKNYLHNTVPNL
ncbi:hypothetical protein [Spiroplasma endosymbiont of Aleiodes alternator]